MTHFRIISIASEGFSPPASAYQHAGSKPHSGQEQTGCRFMARDSEKETVRAYAEPSDNIMHDKIRVRGEKKKARRRGKTQTLLDSRRR
jgi:hypothetical protein